MTEQEAIETLKKHKEQIDKKYINTRNAKAIEKVLDMIDERDKIKQEYDRDTHILQNQLDLADAKNIEKDKIIDLMANHMYAMQAITHISEFESQEDVKKHFENVLKEL